VTVLVLLPGASGLHITYQHNSQPMNSKTSRPYWLHALSPLHVGAGRGVGYIDLPLVREKVTTWPYVPGSSVKGIVAAHHKSSEQSDLFKTAFGCGGDSDALAGALVFSDARLVALPVPSFFGTFAWITSPFALRRLARDLVMLNVKSPGTIPMPVSMGDALTPQDTTVLSEGGDNRIFLEDLDLARKNDEQTTLWAAQIAQWLFGEDKNWSDQFINRFAIVADEVFNFLTHTATEVRARIRIGEAGTAADQALWYEESLPAETLLGGFVWCEPPFKGRQHEPNDLLLKFASGDLYLQVGGKATIGHGRVRCRFTANDSTPHEHQYPIHPHS